MSIVNENPTETPTRPRGKHAVVEAILQAAAELFAEQGPSASSNRDIAERAGVNYGLIHRHFGSREDLIREVMTRMARDFRASLERAVREGRSPLRAATESPAYVRALGRAALDGLDLTALQHENPTIDSILELLAESSEHGELGVDDRIRIALVSASVLGWAVFGPFVRDAVDLEDLDDAELSARMETMLAAMVPAASD